MTRNQETWRNSDKIMAQITELQVEGEEDGSGNGKVSELEKLEENILALNGNTTWIGQIS